MKHGLLLATLIGSAALSAQSPPVRASSPAQPPATVTGRVLDDRGEPIVNARVGLVPQEQGTPVVLTDDRGRFTLAVPAGQFRVVASKTGHAKHDVAAAPGAPLEIRLVRSAAISGRALDELGEPVVNARVTLETADAAKTEVLTTTTDDRGEYRLSGLGAGVYAVSITPFVTMGANGFEFSSPATIAGNMAVVVVNTSRVYYPGVATREAAEPIRLAAGDERSNVDMALSSRQYSQQLAAELAAGPAQVRAQTEAILNRMPPGMTTATDGTGIMRGRVASTDGQPIVGAQVAITRTNSRTRVARTDATGAFEMTNLPPGRYRIDATKAGFSQTPPGPLSAPRISALTGSMVELADGEKRERIDIRLTPFRTLEGRVLDELGDPVDRASVVVYRLRYQNGRQRLTEVGVSRQTNDRGQYRVSGLGPGRYVIAASVGAVSSADIPGYARTYYPGSPTVSEVQYVTVTGQDTIGIDITLARAKTARIAGRALLANGEPFSGSLRLVPSSAASVVATSAGAWMEGDAFEFSNVAPGQYVIQASKDRPNSFTEGEFASMPVAISGGDVTGLVVQTTAGSSITGRVTFNSPRPPSKGPFALRATPVDSDLSPGDVSANVHDDWTFEIHGVHGPRRLQATNAPPGWALEAIRVHGADATDRILPFGTAAQSIDDVEVVLTDRVNTLSASVTEDSKPASGALVFVFPVDRDRRYPASRFFRTATVGPDGTASIDGLPSGGYYVAAIGQMPADGAEALQDPTFLEPLIPRATTVFLGEAERRTVALRIR